MDIQWAETCELSLWGENNSYNISLKMFQVFFDGC